MKQTRDFARHALVPRRPGAIKLDYARAFSTLYLDSALAKLTPPERAALRCLVDGGDLLEVEGEKFLLAHLDEDTLEILAAFEAELADFENDDEPEVDDEDDDRENDNPADPGGLADAGPGHYSGWAL